VAYASGKTNRLTFHSVYTGAAAVPLVVFYKSLVVLPVAVAVAVAVAEAAVAVEPFGLLEASKALGEPQLPPSSSATLSFTTIKPLLTAHNNWLTTALSVVTSIALP